MKIISFAKTTVVMLLAMSCGVSLANTSIGNPIDVGSLTSFKSFKDIGENYYRFNLPVSTPVSIFLNGLSAGYQIQLLDANGNVLKTSSNNGTTWTSSTNTGTTGGSIVAALNGNIYYFVHVSPATLTGNPQYKSQDGSYTVNMIPDNAPNTITVAAKNSVPIGTTTYTASGSKDEITLNQAIAFVGNKGGGTILLRPGTYSISNNVLATFDNITLTGAGWSTVLKLANSIRLEDAGLLRSAFHASSQNLVITHFSNQHFLHLALDGNKSGGTSVTNSYGNFGTYLGSSFDDMRVHDFPHYGFDPHQNQDAKVNTHQITITNSLSDHNNVDGMTTDGCSDSIFNNNILDANGRHGINIVTGSTNNSYLNNIATNNGSNGITIQPGGDLSIVSNNNVLNGNITQKNTGAGIYVYRAQGTQIMNNAVSKNGKYGIQLRSSSYNTVSGNTVANDSQNALGSYAGIYMSNDSILYSTHNQILQNFVSASTPTTYKYGIAESGTSDDYNTVSLNTIQGISVPIRLKGLHSTNTSNTILP